MGYADLAAERTSGCCWDNDEFVIKIRDHTLMKELVQNKKVYNVFRIRWFVVYHCFKQNTI